MKLSEIIKTLNLTVLNSANLEVDVVDAYSSDLLSDVMGNAKSGQIWITMQTHKNVAAIASLKDIPAVIITGKSNPDEDMINHAISEDICILRTDLTCFHICGQLHSLLNSEV